LKSAVLVYYCERSTKWYLNRSTQKDGGSETRPEKG